MANLFCEHWGLFSETWPTSGMMRDGRVYGLPTREHPITVSESLLLRSPKASEGQGGALGEAEALRRGNTVKVRNQIMDLVAGQGLKVSRQADNLLPTPSVAHLRNHDEDIDGYLERRQDFIDGKTLGMPGASLGVAVRMQSGGIDLMPTPTTWDSVPARSGEARERQLHRGGSSSRRKSSGNLREDIMELLPTPITSDLKGTSPNDSFKQLRGVNKLLPTPTTMDSRQGDNESSKNRNSPSVGALVHMIDWGKFGPAIERWEQTLDRPAPAPTKPDGKDGAHRLSSEFTEWMMGLPAGWITGVGLSRNEELKACGNGVVPQQAELALRILLEGLPVERERERTVMFPTPTVSDTYTDNLASTQQKAGSMHSVTLPQAVRMVDGVE